MAQTYADGSPGTGFGQPCADTATETGSLVALDHALRALRRLAVRPPVMAVPLPGTNRRVDFAKLLACAAIEALSAPGAEDGPATVKAVAAALDLEHSTVSRVVSDAEADGLVIRSPHPTDRRSSVLALTDEGHEVVCAFDQARLGFLAGLMRDWAHDDVAQLARLLDRFVDTVATGRDCWSEWVSEPDQSGTASESASSTPSAASTSRTTE